MHNHTLPILLIALLRINQYLNSRDYVQRVYAFLCLHYNRDLNSLEKSALHSWIAFTIELSIFICSSLQVVYMREIQSKISSTVDQGYNHDHISLIR
jgi:hypothetical protein